MTNPLFDPPRPAHDAQALAIDYNLAVGAEFLYFGKRIRLERLEGDGSVDLRNLATNALLSVKNSDGSTSRPTVEWMRQAYAAHQLATFGSVPEDASRRQARFLLLDANVAEAKDGKVRWRASLAWRALADEVKNTDAATAAWLDAHYGRQPGDLAFPKPSPSSLRRWMRRLKKGDRKIGALVSQAGRPRGHSQLHSLVDAIVSQAALYFYAAGEGVTQVQAESYMDELVKKLNASLPGNGPPFKTPSRRSLQLRINKLACFETWEKKYGRAAAERKFRGAGEPLLVDHFLEVCLMDATQLEQIIVFDEGYALPVMKTNIVVIMDCLSHAIIGWHVYAGPNRGETTAQAYFHCFEPNKFPERMVTLYPGLRACFGRPAALLPDNEKALVGPETVAGYNEAGTTIIPAPVAMPTAKAALERFIRTLKTALAQLPGTLIDPRRALELGYEEIEAAAEITIHQLRVTVSQAIAEHNANGASSIPSMTPVQVILARSGTRATPAFEDLAPIRAALCRTFRVFVTRNGVEKDGVRYRDTVALDGLFDNNFGRLGNGARGKNGFAARGRRNDGDIDKIEIYDDHAGVWVALPSTQPAYTAGLSFWEHQMYAAAAKKRNEPFSSAQTRLRSKTETRRLHEEMLPKAKFRSRAKMAALAMSEKVAELNGKAFVLPDDVAAIAQSLADLRTDDPTLGAQSRASRAAKSELNRSSEVGDAGGQDDWDDAEFDQEEE